MVKGSENLALETIVKIEKVLGIKLIEVSCFEGLKDNSTPISVDYTEYAVA